MTVSLDHQDQELKNKHRQMWALGDYSRVATEAIADLGPELVTATAIGPGQRVLDVAAGSGNVAIPAAAAGATVIASDLTPELFDTGRKLAADRGVSVDWQQADAEALPYADSEFDAVLSCVGVMFAPHHDRSSAELLRVCRPGGTLGVISWTPEGFIGEMFKVMKPYAPAPPAGAQPPMLWGTEEHVRELFGNNVTDLRMERRNLAVDRFASGAEFRDFFKTNYGPTIAIYRGLVDDPDRAAALDRELEAIGDGGLRADGRMPWEYLLVTARRTD
jgi:ubiquinone/menaquinone biosynthesis C-methylase UbiE